MKEAKNGNMHLYSHGVAADLTISFWGNYVQLTPEDIGLDKALLNVEMKDLPDQVIWSEFLSLGRKRLIKKKDLSKISKIKSAAWYLLKTSAFPFPFGNSYFIPNNVLANVLSEMEKLEGKFYEAVENFLLVYDALRKTMIVEYEEVFEKILRSRANISEQELLGTKHNLVSKLETKYPSASVLRGKFHFDFVVYEVGSADLQPLTKEDAKAHLKIEILNKDLEEKYKQKMHDRVDNFLDGVVAQLKEMVLDVTKKLLIRLNGEDGVSMKSINAFKRFVDEFKSLDFVGWDVESKLTELQKKLGNIGKDELMDEDFQKSLAKDLEDIRTFVGSVEKDKVLGKFKRMIQVEE